MISIWRRHPSLLIPRLSAKTGVDVALSNKRSSAASKRPYNKNKARNSDIYQVTQPIESANRYTILNNLPETTICQDGNVAPKVTKVTKFPQTTACRRRLVEES